LGLCAFDFAVLDCGAFGARRMTHEPSAISRQWTTLFRFELVMLLRDRFCAVALLGIMLCSSVAIFQGHRQILQIEQEQSRVIALLAAQHQQRAAAIPEEGADAGDLAYYTFYAAADTTHAWSFVAVGNRALEPAVQRIRMLGLQAQLYDGQAKNPENAVAGSFDFAFVVVFLLPLLCVVLCHNVRSSERESGRIGLLESTAQRVGTLIRLRLLVRGFCAFLGVFLPLLAFALLQRLPAFPLLLMALCLIGYLCVWLALIDRITPASRSSAENAMRGLMLWLLLVLVIPQAGQLIINQLLPTSLGKLITLQHRQSVARAWDIPKKDSFEVFFRDHPEWKNTTPVLVRFHWKWYYAFHHAADMQLADQARAYAHNALARQRAADYLGFLSPAVALQNSLDSIADSRIERVLVKREAIINFHTRLRRYFYPYIFEERLIRQAEFLQAPRFKTEDFAISAGVLRASNSVPWALGFWVLGFWLLCWAALRRNGAF
jgi:ABC-2 type transport system permease protein